MTVKNRYASIKAASSAFLHCRKVRRVETRWIKCEFFYREGIYTVQDLREKKRQNCSHRTISSRDSQCLLKVRLHCKFRDSLHERQDMAYWNQFHPLEPALLIPRPSGRLGPVDHSPIVRLMLPFSTAVLKRWVPLAMTCSLENG